MKRQNFFTEESFLREREGMGKEEQRYMRLKNNKGEWEVWCLVVWGCRERGKKHIQSILKFNQIIIGDLKAKIHRVTSLSYILYANTQRSMD